jgi:hypothetical protein
LAPLKHMLEAGDRGIRPRIGGFDTRFGGLLKGRSTRREARRGAGIRGWKASAPALWLPRKLLQRRDQEGSPNNPSLRAAARRAPSPCPATPRIPFARLMCHLLTLAKIAKHRW